MEKKITAEFGFMFVSKNKCCMFLFLALLSPALLKVWVRLWLC